MNINDYSMEVLQNLQRNEENEDREQKYIVKEMMGDTFATYFEDTGDGEADRYLNDEGEDVRDIAAKAEAMRDALREDGITADDEAWLTEQARLRAEEEENNRTDEKAHKHHWDATHGL